MKTILMILILFFNLSAQAVDYGDLNIEWREVVPSFKQDSKNLFQDSVKVELFESVLFLDGNLYYQTQNANRESQIYRINLETGEKQFFPSPEGKILGWTTYEKELLILVKNKLIFLDPLSLQKRNEVPISIQSNNFREIVVLDGHLYSFQSKKVFKYDLKTGEKKDELEVPFESIQRVIPISEGFLLLYSSFWGNKLKLINASTFAFEKEVVIPTNHRSLFKLVYTDKKRYLVADPLTKNFSEWMDFGGRILEVTNGLQISKSPPAARYSPIENFIEYKFRITAKEDTPETSLNILLPKQNVYSQQLIEERFSKSSDVKLDSFGNRILSLPIPALKKDEVFEHSPYEAKLIRYKISFDIRELKLNLADYKVPKDLNRYTTNNSSLKFEEDRVSNKRNEVIADSTQVVDVLIKTQSYVASIPYKSGLFQSAPFVIEKNNGGCTEHSYVTMAFLRSLGISSRLVWNYLPTESSEIIFFNHKFVEAWLPAYGWIPMEPLAPPNKIPGTTNARHVIFAGLEKTSLEDIAGGDRLFNLNKNDIGLSKKLSIRFDIFKSNVSEEFESTPIKTRVLPKTSGEESFIP